MKPIFLNGKFYAGELNGVHRVADRLIRELDAQLTRLAPDERPEVTLFIPVRRRWAPMLQTIRIVEEARGHSQLWEQFILPLRAKGGVLVNLCNLAPVLHRDKILMLHDAQFLFPDSSYPARLRWGYRILTPLMARTSRLVLTVSEYSRQMLDLLGVAPRANTEVLSNGADHMHDTPSAPDIVARLGLTPGRYAVHIGSAKAYKNTAVVFEAFADPALSDIALVMVGPGKEALERGGLTPPPSAVFAGRVDDGELRGLYEQGLCLLFPSRTEGFGLPPVEAMTLGCPAVVSPAGAIPEACRDAALYADVDRPEAWIAAVRSYADQPDLREAKVAMGRARAGDFTWVAAGVRLAGLLWTSAKP